MQNKQRATATQKRQCHRLNVMLTGSIVKALCFIFLSFWMQNTSAQSSQEMCFYFQLTSGIPVRYFDAECTNFTVDGVTGHEEPDKEGLWDLEIKYLEREGCPPSIQVPTHFGVNLKDWICDLCAGRIGFPMKIQGFWTTAYLSICSGVWIWQMLISAQSLLPLWISVAYEGQSDWRQLCPQNPSEQVVPKLLIRLLSHIFINFFLNGLKIIMGNTSFRWNNSFRYFISVCLVCLKINNVVLCRKNKAEYCFSKGKLCYGEKWMIYIFKPPFVVLQFRSQNCIVV